MLFPLLGLLYSDMTETMTTKMSLVHCSLRSGSCFSCFVSSTWLHFSLVLAPNFGFINLLGHSWPLQPRKDEASLVLTSVLSFCAMPSPSPLSIHVCLFRIRNSTFQPWAVEVNPGPTHLAEAPGPGESEIPKEYSQRPQAPQVYSFPLHPPALQVARAYSPGGSPLPSQWDPRKGLRSTVSPATSVEYLGHLPLWGSNGWL